LALVAAIAQLHQAKLTLCDAKPGLKGEDFLRQGLLVHVRSMW